MGEKQTLGALWAAHSVGSRCCAWCTGLADGVGGGVCAGAVKTSGAKHWINGWVCTRVAWRAGHAVREACFVCKEALLALRA